MRTIFATFLASLSLAGCYGSGGSIKGAQVEYGQGLQSDTQTQGTHIARCCPQLEGYVFTPDPSGQGGVCRHCTFEANLGLSCDTYTASSVCVAESCRTGDDTQFTNLTAPASYCCLGRTQLFAAGGTQYSKTCFKAACDAQGGSSLASPCR